MIALIIQILLLSAILVMAFFCQRQNVQATERLKQAKERDKRWSGFYEPPFTYRFAVLSKRVIVYGIYCCEGYMSQIVIKEYSFDPADDEDRAFAIREAEELIEKLREK